MHHPQTVKIGNKLSSSLTLNTGAPQGCVLSPFLFSLYTHDCVSSHENAPLIKFADDTTVVGLISNCDKTSYEVDTLVSWCSDNSLLLNTSKTKEIIVDFRKTRLDAVPLIINGNPIEIVHSFKLLGSTLSYDMKWEVNIDSIAKKAHQRIYFLRRLKQFGIARNILIQFYRAVIESVLTFSIPLWFGALSLRDKSKLEKIVKSASRIIGTELPALEEIYQQRVVRKASLISKDTTHPANKLFQLLPSGRRYRSLKVHTTRFKNSFYPCAVQLLSDQCS